MSDQPTNLVIYTDPGKDIDDEAALVLLSALTRKHHLTFPLAVVANLAPSDMRARLARGTLGQLKMPMIPVVRGSDCDIREYHVWAHEFDVNYLAKDQTIFAAEDPEDAAAYAAQFVALAMEMVPDKSVTVLLLSGFTDAFELFMHHEYTVRRKVREVVMMSGVEPLDDIKEPEMRLMPANAFNVNVDQDAARGLVNLARFWGILTVTVTRHATHVASVPRVFFDEMGVTSDVAKRLYTGARYGLQSLWEAVHYPMGDPRRAGLLECHTPEWFREQYLDPSAPSELTQHDLVWDLVTRLHMHDPLTLMAAVPKLREKLFAPYRLTVNMLGEPVDHLFIGLSPEEHGLIDPANVSGFITAGIKEGLNA